MPEVVKSQARHTAQVTLPDGRVYEGPRGMPLAVFFASAQAEDNTPLEGRAVAAMVGNRLRELTFPVRHDMAVRPIVMSDPDGVRIYRRSLVFLLVAAAKAALPQAQVFVEHSLPQQAYFCHVEGRAQLSPAELATLDATMRQMIEAATPIQRHRMSLEEAKDFFAQRGDEEKVRLLAFRTRDYLRVYQLGDFSDYFFGYMVPSTDYLRWFGLEHVEDGFLLRYPSRRTPGQITPWQGISKVADVFQQQAQWLRLLNVRDIGQLNQANQAGYMRELILVTEALHERRIAEISHHIADRHTTGAELILIAGPTSSGKTTFSKRLAIQLMTHGIQPFTLALDDFFVDRDKTPLDDQGEYDFETLHAVNIDLFNDCLTRLMAGQPVQLPRFDFHLGKSVPGKTVQLSREHVIIVEGIHGLNPELTPAIPTARMHRIYVSALTQLNIDRYNRVSTTDVRLIRRIVRDVRHRGWNATDTLARWESVSKGERRNIFPYQERADDVFNSALVYELAVLRPLVEPLLLSVNLDHPKWTEANRLLSFLAWVAPTDDNGIPDNSLLREFIGGSNLQEYYPGAR